MLFASPPGWNDLYPSTAQLFFLVAAHAAMLPTAVFFYRGLRAHFRPKQILAALSVGGGLGYAIPALLLLSCLRHWLERIHWRNIDPSDLHPLAFSYHYGGGCFMAFAACYGIAVSSVSLYFLGPYFFRRRTKADTPTSSEKVRAATSDVEN